MLLHLTCRCLHMKVIVLGSLSGRDEHCCHSNRASIDALSDRRRSSLTNFANSSASPSRCDGKLHNSASHVLSNAKLPRRSNEFSLEARVQKEGHGVP